MLQFCRQNKNCKDFAEDHELSQNHMLGGFGKAWCFPMTTSISSSAKTHHEEWICLWEMHKPLPVTCSSTQKKWRPALWLCYYKWMVSKSTRVVLLVSTTLHDIRCSLGSCPKAPWQGFSPVPAAACLSSASNRWDVGTALRALARSKLLVLEEWDWWQLSESYL